MTHCSGNGHSTYKSAGVDIDLATDLLKRLKPKFAAAKRPEMLAPIGGFGGLFQIDLAKWKNPVMVASIDGVGTKLMVAAMMHKYDTVGHDIVNHCVNDISVQGAEPVYFLDYIGIGKLRSPLYEEVVGGIADACKEVGCALLGGETAEISIWSESSRAWSKRTASSPAKKSAPGTSQSPCLPTDFIPTDSALPDAFSSPCAVMKSPPGSKS